MGVELVAFGIKLFMTAASTLVYHLKWLAVMQSAAALWLLWLYLDWVPHMHAVVNNIRVATQTSILYCAVLLLFLGFLPGVDVHDPGAVAPSFKGMTPDSKPAPAFILVDARQVEILSRCCRTWIDADTLDEEAVALAETIMKVGMAQLPSNPYVILLYASFLIDVQQSYQSGYSVLQQAKKADPSFLERFAIFSREQQHTQKSAGAVPGQATDLVSYVELSRNLRLALKVHKEALMAIRMFWACLVQVRLR
ncbi:tiny macrocysts protein B, partial [Haematococcus lacustris]